MILVSNHHFFLVLLRLIVEISQHFLLIPVVDHTQSKVKPDEIGVVFINHLEDFVFPIVEKGLTQRLIPRMDGTI